MNWSDILDEEIIHTARVVGQMAAKPGTSRGARAEPGVARWVDTEALIRDRLREERPEAHEVPDDEGAELRSVLQRHEVRGALQSLLTARLTERSTAHAAGARAALRLALAGAGAPDSGRGGYVSEQSAQRLAEYLDDQISLLAASVPRRGGQAGHRTEVTGGRGVHVGDGGIQFNLFADASNSRIEALLGAIERQAAALADPARGGEAEAEWLARYRRQARGRHGYLYPPDFDRRRRIPVAEIYVDTPVVEYFGTDSRPGPRGEPGLRVTDLVGRLDRTVLLGDPGGGKTTAANVLANLFASDADQRVPFLVTLREYAAKTPLEWSVADYVAQNLKAVYQSPAPNWLVERLLLTGRAVVIFDGLDELLDTSRRRDVSERVEQFCSAYPLTPVLVTSRVVGYDQARLDDEQFTCYRLGRFGDDEVPEYVRKWFATQEHMPAAESAAKAGAFLAESAKATDLRANPLLLSLMCILYRGAGSLPGDRAGIYAKCAELLLRKWDEQRELYRKVRADHLVEPAIGYLAWWLFTHEDSLAEATERELTARTAEFLYERGYETEDEARAAAREFVEFCRSRMWVFSDAGTTADGEKLYAFTHRTFLEYFAARHLAATCDSPEELGRALVAREELTKGDLVGELAIKLKGDVSDRGADRVYAVLLDPAADDADPGVPEPDRLWRRGIRLAFLARCLSSAKPSPATIRKLTAAAAGYLFDADMDVQHLGPLQELVRHSGGGSGAELIAAELSQRIAGLVDSGDPARRSDGLGFVLDFDSAALSADPFWLTWSRALAGEYAAAITSDAAHNVDLRIAALYAGLISVKQALSMPGGLGALLREFTGRISVIPRPPYPLHLVQALFDRNSPLSSSRASGTESIVNALTTIGEYLVGCPARPWAFAEPYQSDEVSILETPWVANWPRLPVSEVTGLGVAAVVCIDEELRALFIEKLLRKTLVPLTPQELTKIRISGALHRYIARRKTGTPEILPGLPVPVEFRLVFRDWAEGQVNFTQAPKG